MLKNKELYIINQLKIHLYFSVKKSHKGNLIEHFKSLNILRKICMNTSIKHKTIFLNFKKYKKFKVKEEITISKVFINLKRIILIKHLLNQRNKI